MPLASNSLATLAEVKEELEITVPDFDDYLVSLINAVSTAIENFLGRLLGSKKETEVVPGFGGYRITVTRTPVTILTEILLIDPWVPATEVDIADVTIDNAVAGLLYYRAGWPWTVPLPPGSIKPSPLVGQEQKSIQVKYTGGYILPNMIGPAPKTLPLDIERACVLAVAAEYLRRGSDRRIKRESLMSYSVTYQNAVGDTATQAKLFPASPFPSDVMMLLLPHRRIAGV